MNISANWRLRGTRLRLEGEVCPSCETKIFPPRDICPDCGEDTIGKPNVDGMGGVVLTFTRYDEKPDRGVGGLSYSYTIMVQLADGELVFGNLAKQALDNEGRIDPMGIAAGAAVNLVDLTRRGIKTTENLFEPAEIDLAVGKGVMAILEVMKD